MDLTLPAHQVASQLIVDGLGVSANRLGNLGRERKVYECAVAFWQRDYSMRRARTMNLSGAAPT